MGTKQKRVASRVLTLIIVFSLTIVSLLASLTMPGGLGHAHDDDCNHSDSPGVVSAATFASELSGVSSYRIVFNLVRTGAVGPSLTGLPGPGTWSSSSSSYTLTLNRGSLLSVNHFFSPASYGGSASTTVYCCSDKVEGKSGTCAGQSTRVHATRTAWCASNSSRWDNQNYDGRVQRPSYDMRVEDWFADANDYMNGSSRVVSTSGSTATVQLYAVWITSGQSVTTQNKLTLRTAPSTPQCAQSGCTRTATANGYCSSHQPQIVTYPCQVCGQTFASQASLNSHLSVHTPQSQNCQLCNQSGHDATNCPNRCQICQGTGHTASNCPYNQPADRCQLCNQTGHIASSCPNRCQICQGTGHTALNCPQAQRCHVHSVVLVNGQCPSRCQVCGVCASGHTAANCPQNSWPCPVHNGYTLPNCTACTNNYCQHLVPRTSCPQSTCNGCPHNVLLPATSCQQCNPPPVSVTFRTEFGRFTSTNSTSRTASVPVTQGQPILAWLGNQEQPVQHPYESTFRGWAYTSTSGYATSGMIFTAEWNPPPPRNVSITWNMNGATRYEPSGFYPPSQAVIVTDVISITLPDLYHPTYTNFTWTATATGINRPNLAVGSTFEFTRSNPNQYTFTAVWDVSRTRPYTITFTPGDWSAAPANWMVNPPQGVTQSGSSYQMTANALQMNVMLPSATSVSRPDHVLSGWEVVTTGVSTEVTLGYALQNMASQDVTVRALWRSLEYEVHFNATVGDFPASGTLPAGWTRRGSKLMVFTGTSTTIVPTQIPLPESSDYTFTRWVDSENVIGNMIPSGGATVYAEWTAIPFTLRLHVNPPTGGQLVGGLPRDLYVETEYIRGQNMTHFLQVLESLNTWGYPQVRFQAPNDEATLPGYRFIGWSDNPNTLNTYSQISSMPRGAAMSGGETGVELYAIWEARLYTITFNLNENWNEEQGHSALNLPNPYVMNVPFGSTITPPTATQITRVGYVLQGWHGMDVSFGLGIPTNPFVWPATMPAENIEVQAAWTPKQLTVRFNTNVAGMSVPDRTGVYVRSFVSDLNAGLVPHPSGNRVFLAWYTRDGSIGDTWDEAYRLDPAGFQVPVTDVTVYNLYARWSETLPPMPDPDYYSFRFDAQGGLVNGQPHHTLQQREAGDIITNADVPADPVQEGFTFVGWFSAACVAGCDQRSHVGCAGTQVNFPYTIGGANFDITVYARWSARTYTLTFTNPVTSLQVGPARELYVNDSLAGLAPNIPDMSSLGYIAGGWWTRNGYQNNSLNEDNDIEWGERVDFDTVRMGAENVTYFARYYRLRIEVQYINAVPNGAEGITPIATTTIYDDGRSIALEPARFSVAGNNQVGWGFLSDYTVTHLGPGYSFNTSASNYICNIFNPGYHYHFGLNQQNVQFMDLLLLGLDQHVILTPGYGLNEYYRLLSSSDPDALRNSYRASFFSNGLGVLKLYPIWETVDMVTISLMLPETHRDEVSGVRYSGNLVREWNLPRATLQASGLQLMTAEWMNDDLATGRGWVDSQNRKMIDEWAGKTGGNAGIPDEAVEFIGWRIVRPSGTQGDPVEITGGTWAAIYAEIAPFISSSGFITIQALWKYSWDI